MHYILIYISYGWLTFSSIVHFLIDVGSQHIRGKRAPGPETTLSYGLHSSLAFGQVVFGMFCLWLAWTVPAIFDHMQMTYLLNSPA